MILLFKMLWDMFKRVYVTFLESYPIIDAWVSTEIRRLTTILKFCPKICFPYIVCKSLNYMIPVHDLANCVKTIEFGPFYLKCHAWLSTCDQNIASHSQRATRIQGSISMALIMFGKLISSISERNFGASCFSEHMKEWNCENKG